MTHRHGAAIIQSPLMLARSHDVEATRFIGGFGHKELRVVRLLHEPSPAVILQGRAGRTCRFSVE